MLGKHIEIEATFVVLSAAPRDVIQRLEALSSLAHTSLRPAPAQTLHDRYFDMPDRLLRARGFSLRLRRLCGGWHLCLKGRSRRRGAAVQRLEIEGSPVEPSLWAAIAKEVGHGWPGTLGPADSGDVDPARVLREAGFELLQQRDTERRRRDVIDRSGAAVAQLCLDSVAYQVASNTLWHHEVEIEAAAGQGAKLLLILSRALAVAFPGELEPWQPSKLATGFALEALARRSGPTLTGPDADLLPRAYPRLLAELERLSQ